MLSLPPSLRWTDSPEAKARIARIVRAGGPRPRTATSRFCTGNVEVQSLTGLDGLEADRVAFLSRAAGYDREVTDALLADAPSAEEAVAVASVAGFAVGLGMLCAPAWKVAA